MKFKEIASEINAALKRWERDPIINKPHPKYRTKDYYRAGSYARGNRVFVTYVSYPGASSLTKAQALAYLEWIRAGNVGTHYAMPKETA